MRDVNRSVPEVGYERIEMAGEEDFDAENQSILPGSFNIKYPGHATNSRL
jgi:hypothetical protein